jgi:hypothetical protein
MRLMLVVSVATIGSSVLKNLASVLSRTFASFSFAALAACAACPFTLENAASVSANAPTTRDSTRVYITASMLSECDLL